MNCTWRLALIAAWGVVAAGCASSLSGLGGTQSYSCKAPEGVLCTSVAGVYANSLQMNLPSQRTQTRGADPAGNVAAATRGAPISNSAADAAAMRSAPRVLRVWIAPWEDSDGDLQDQSYLYVVVDSGHWLIEHQRTPVRNELTPIAAPSAPAQSNSESAAPAASTAASLPRPGVPLPAGVMTQAPKEDNDAERTDR